MNAPRTSLAITDAPAPWELLGRGYIAMLRFAEGSSAQDAFLPPSLAGRRGASRTAWLMFVDYGQSEVGPYHELLFIPGSFPFEDGQRHLSISRIFVSSMDSVVNGQRNWGIPKELAQFEVRYGENGVDHVSVSQDGRVFAELAFRAWPLSIPFLGALVPSRLRTLAQHHEGRTFVYTPSARGWLQPARTLVMRSDPAVFPDLGAARALLTVAVPRFRMRFPVSRILPHR